MDEADDNFRSALKYSLKLLGYRDRSKAEMCQKLALKGFTDDVVDRALDYLVAKGFVDDRKLAELLRRDAVERRHLGAQGVRSYLLKRGITRDIADEIVGAGIDYLDSAARLAEKKMRTMRHLDGSTVKRRLWGLLARRGYTSDQIRQVLEKIEDKDEG